MRNDAAAGFTKNQNFGKFNPVEKTALIVIYRNFLKYRNLQLLSIARTRS